LRLFPGAHMKAGIAVLLVFYAALALAQDNAARIDCQEFGRVIAAVAVFRDAGADIDKTVALFRRMNPQIPAPRWALVEREVRRMWREALPADEAGFSLYLRCQAQLGDMGRES